MNDEFNKNDRISESNSDIDDFLNKFDEIKKSFEMADSKPSGLPGEQPEQTEPTAASGTGASVSPRRAERLQRIRSKNKETVQSEDKETEESMPKKKKTAKTKTKPKKYRVNIKRLLIALICVGILGCGAVGVWALKVIGDTPPIDADNIYSMLSENSVIYDDQGNEIENLFASGAGLRTNLNFTEIPEDLLNAFIAIEDKTFWDHQGFNVIRIFGAIWDSVTSGESIKGTSTITQQLARNLYLEDKMSVRSLERKVQEAYYAVLLENQLSKEQIIEAYLNTIDLGSGAYGVQAAARTYFSKDVNELTLAECAVLATLPKAPSRNSPMVRMDNEDIDDPDSLDFLYRGETYSLWYRDSFKSRQKLVLDFMSDQGYIDQERYQEAINQDIRAAMNPDITVSTEISSYFADYLIKEVIQALMFERDIDEATARDMIYNGGLRIYSTLNVAMQKIVESEMSNNKNFPQVAKLNRDKAGNILDSKNKILLYKYSNMLDEEGNFTLKPDEYKINEDGSMTVFKGNRLNIYKTEVQNTVDYSVEMKGMYTIENDTFYAISAGFISIPGEYKSRDEDGNLIISSAYFQSSAFSRENSPVTLTEAGMTIPKGDYQLKEKVIQPQSAMVILDYKNGAIKAMAGGRGLSGKLLFNRATGTRQPGSAIKPMAVYGPALQQSVDMVKNNAVSPDTPLWTAASVIDDAPLVLDGKLWPKNWYNAYHGLHTLRRSVEQSVNVNAVKVFNNIGAATSLSFLKKLGVTSVVESGSVNDMNPAALALGGMTKGISPLQMAAGYGTFANEGLYVKPMAYTTVTDKRGNVLLENTSEKQQVMDRGVAFIMTDILRTTVSNGIAGRAAIGSHTVAGKTGTTTDNYDAWFVGMTPHYAASLWIGNDINLELSQGSPAAAGLWSKIMKQVHAGLPQGSFPKADNVTTAAIDTMSGMLPSELSALDPRGTVRNEFFVSGTVPTAADNIHVAVSICKDSGSLATPYCYNAESRVMVRRPEGSVKTYGGFTVSDIDYEAPGYYCHLHNPDPLTYPIDPNKELQPQNPSDGWNNGLPPWIDPNNGNDGNNGNNGNNGNGNGGNETPPITDSNPGAVMNPEDSQKPEWLD